MKRRKFLFGLVAAAGCAAVDPKHLASEGTPRPHLFLRDSRSPVAGLRSVSEVRDSIKTGRTAELWRALRDRSVSEMHLPPVSVSDPLPDRSPAAVLSGNPDYVVCFEAGQRIIRNALVHVLTDDKTALQTAIRQLEFVLSEDTWPDWIDQAHIRFGHPADLRTGMLSHDIGLAYDWLYPSLTTQQRSWLIDGLDRRGIQPYLTSLRQNPWWTSDLNNWMTTICGGAAIAGMALAEDHPASRHLIDVAVPLMNSYLSRYGEEGEFNESVAYANATIRPVAFDSALRYHTGGATNRLAEWPYPQAARWSVYTTIPAGRITTFGDGHADAKPFTAHIAAIAAATSDPVLQGYYEAYPEPAGDPIELLWYDSTLASASPEGLYPLGRVFNGHGKIVSCRTSWNYQECACVVYGKAGREENHEHNDVGQLCIDAYGERLISDPGSPSGYPADFFEAERWNYYNASIVGHNIVQVGVEELRIPETSRGIEKNPADFAAVSGSYLQSGFDDRSGGFWQMDLTPAYHTADRIRRTVLFLAPGAIAVLDEIDLPSPDMISLRWHTGFDPHLSGVHFHVRGSKSRLVGSSWGMDGVPLVPDLKRHEYSAPFDKSRNGDLLEQRREPYLMISEVATTVRWLTLFGVGALEESFSIWERSSEGWRWEGPGGVKRLTLDNNKIRLSDATGGNGWEVSL